MQVAFTALHEAAKRLDLPVRRNPIFVEKSHRKKPATLSNEASTTIDR